MRSIAICLAPLAAICVVAACITAPGNAPVPGPEGPPVDAAIEHIRVPYDGLPAPAMVPRTPVRAELVSSRVDTMQLMFAAGEMQTSGEPFASIFAGRNLADYNRWILPPNLYQVHVFGGTNGFVETSVDLFGFSTAVESYEYSKYHMNMVANQTGAGVSLVNGPLLANLPGATPFDRLRGRVEQLIIAAGTDSGGFATIPDGGSTNSQNDFGFPGLWPNLAPYRSFDPTLAPNDTIAHSCSSKTGYGGLQVFGNNPVPIYECDYNSLRLPNRVAQTEPVIGPGILGFATWKEALWAIDFVGRLHDTNTNGVTAIAPGDIVQVGRRGNTVLAVEPPTAVPGVFIGSTPLEGMWGLTMSDEIDNAGNWLLSSLATTDGATLSGFPSVMSALTYDYDSPLVWFPTAIAVTEGPGIGPTPGTPSAYPAVASLAIDDATSHAVDLGALAQGYSLYFGMTDARNVAVGQQLGMQIAFGGYPFSADDGLPDGEDTPHDRALAVMRVAFVDLDRIHVDPATGVVVDTATVQAAAVARGTQATTVALGHVVIGLRHLLMACNASVSQYGAPDGDMTKDALGVLNSIPIHPQGNGSDGGSPPLFSAHVRKVLMAQADFVYGTLTQADGSVANGATLAGTTWTPTSDPTLLESQSAALRVLGEAWFLSGLTKYQDRARQIARVLLTALWSDTGRMFRAVANGADDVVMTAERFAWLQQALRETHEALWIPGDPLLDRTVLEDRVARVNKLYLNGWDDLNADQLVSINECLDGRLQLGEQALTGELGTSSNAYVSSSGADRDADCVKNIAAAQTASVLAGSVHFHAP